MRIAWICPFCKDALPELSKRQKEKSVKHHYATKHKREIPTIRVFGKPGASCIEKTKAARRQPALQAGKKSLAKKQWLNAEVRAKARDAKTGHSTTWVQPDWTQWAGKTSTNKHSARLRVCNRCWAWYGRSLSSTCPGSPPKPRAAAKIWVEQDAHRAKSQCAMFVTAWNTTLGAADLHFDFFAED